MHFTHKSTDGAARVGFMSLLGLARHRSTLVCQGENRFLGGHPSTVQFLGGHASTVWARLGLLGRVSLIELQSILN